MPLITDITNRLTEWLLKGVSTDIVELGSHSFRRLRAEFNEGRFLLRETFSTPAPRRAFTFSSRLPGGIFDEEGMKEAIEKLFPKTSPRPEYVTVLLPDAAFHVGLVSISATLLKTGAKALVEREVQTSASLPLSEYQVTWEVGQGKGPKRELLFCAISRTTCEEVRELFENLDFVPLSIQPSFISLFGLVRLVENDPASHPSVVIHFGHETTVVAVTVAGLLRRIQFIPFGAVDLSTTLAQKAGMTLEQAEAALAREVILLEEPASEAQAEIPAYRILEPLFITFLQKIYGVLQLHANECPQEAAFQRVLLSGGGALLKHLDRLIAANLGLPTTCLSASIAPLIIGGMPESKVTSFAPLLGAIALRPWDQERFDRMVA
ncbi:MAG: pilus assembly protein PilM [Candidatus Ozemobacteraceae bacterium]